MTSSADGRGFVIPLPKNIKKFYYNHICDFFKTALSMLLIYVTTVLIITLVYFFEVCGCRNDGNGITKTGNGITNHR